MKKIHNLQYTANKEEVKIVFITMQKECVSADPHPDVDNMPLNNTNPKDAELLESFDNFMSGQTFKVIKETSTPGTQPNLTPPLSGSTELNELSDTNTWSFAFNDTAEKHKLFNLAPFP